MRALSTNSNLVFVWHDNSGQTIPDNSQYLQTKINPDGFSINIADSAIIDDPLVIITSSSSTNVANHVINIGKNSQVEILEYLMSDDPNATNQITCVINCSIGSKVKHCILHHAKDNVSISQSSNTTIKQDSGSNVQSNIFAFGGKTSNIALTVNLQGEHAECQTSCLAYTQNEELQNVVLKIEHMVPYCNSTSLARGVLKDKSITDFLGRIIVHPGAKKTLADLQIKNILCSAKAQANHKPELEIYNDDVKCSHGASTGQMNEEALFYMRSRGLDEKEATNMLIEGFIQPVIVSCTIPMIADYVLGVVKERANGT